MDGAAGGDVAEAGLLVGVGGPGEFDATLDLVDNVDFGQPSAAGRTKADRRLGWSCEDGGHYSE